MLAQLHLSEKQRWAVIEYLKTFSPRFDTERPAAAVVIPPKPPVRRLRARFDIWPTDLAVTRDAAGFFGDLFRTLSTGLNGTPMPSYAGALSVKDRWALVAYIMSIATRDRPRGMMSLVGEEVQGMRIDMRAAMAGMMGGRGMMGGGGGTMDRNMRDRMKDMMGR
jgi:hypothetical protein